MRNHIIETPLTTKRLEHVIPGDIEKLLQSKQGDLAPGTINHVRQFLVRAFNKAKRAGEWFGANPAEEVESRKVPESVVEILRPEEVLPFFVELDLDQRVVFAGAISSGLRKGELCGLLKKDLDVPRRLVIARHSYAQPFPKSKKQRVVRVPEEFVPFYEYALQAYPGSWLFPHLDGTSRTGGTSRHGWYIPARVRRGGSAGGRAGLRHGTAPSHGRFLVEADGSAVPPDHCLGLHDEDRIGPRRVRR